MPKQIRHWMGLVWKKCPVSTVLIVYTVPGALGGNSMPSNKSSNLNFGIPTPERS